MHTTPCSSSCCPAWLLQCSLGRSSSSSSNIHTLYNVGSWSESWTCNPKVTVRVSVLAGTVGGWSECTVLSSTCYTTTEVRPLSKAPNPLLLPWCHSVLCVCCTWIGEMQHKFEYGTQYLAICHVLSVPFLILILSKISLYEPKKCISHLCLSICTGYQLLLT